jgi:hypothetical protein
MGGRRELDEDDEVGGNGETDVTDGGAGGTDAEGRASGRLDRVGAALAGSAQGVGVMWSRGDRGEARWPMALAVLATGLLRAALPHELRAGDSRWLFLVVVGVLLGVLILGDPGRIDRDKRWLRVTTVSLIGVISVANAIAAVKLVLDILDTTQYQPGRFTNDAHVLLVSGGAIWLTNVIAFGLWYWDVDSGGAAARARAHGSSDRPAFVFPEMINTEFVAEGWYPHFVDYLHLSFHAATAFSPTDVSAVRPWAKLMVMAEEAISLIVALLVVARAVNILH